MMIPFTTKPCMGVVDTYVVWRVSRKATPTSIFFFFYFITIEIKIYKAMSKLISKNCDQTNQSKFSILFHVTSEKPPRKMIFRLN